MAATDDATRKSAIYVKLGILFTEKVHNAAQATAAWQALLALEPENRRAQDALKKLYLQSKDWDALEAFYASQNKWDELVRVLERQAETEDDGGARRPVEQDRRALSRSPEQGGPRPEGVREGAVASTRQNLPAALALIPLYEKAKEIKRLGEVLLVELRHTSRDPAERHPRMQRLADLLDMGGGRQARRAAHRAAGARRGADRRMGDHDVAPAGRRERRLARAGRGLRGGGAARRGASRGGRRCCALLGDAGGRLRGRAGRSRAGDRAQPDDPRDLAPRTPTRWRRSSASTSRPAASPTCSPSTTRSWRWPRARPRSWRSASSSPSLYEEEIKQPDKAIELYLGDRRPGSDAAAGAARARSPVSAARPLEGAGGDDRPRRSICRPTWPRSPS